MSISALEPYEDAKGIGRRAPSGGTIECPGYFVRRMEWTKTDALWRGEWAWEVYDRQKEWVGYKNLRWRDMRMKTRDRAVELASIVPQEVLLGMVDQLDYVSHGVAT